VIRVGFQPIGGPLWMGGRNYLRNLLRAISLVDEPRLQPVLLTSGDDGRELLLPGVERFDRGGALDSAWARRAGAFASLLLGCNHVEQHWLRRARVDISSHGGAPLGARARLPWIYWIPDVQHRSHPEFFTARQRLERDWMFRTALDHAAAVIASSAAARQDLLDAYGSRAERVRVLHFVCSPGVELTRLPLLAGLSHKLGVPAKYFHLPNQFWTHKNHAVVIEALAEASRQVPEMVIVATGAKEDPRSPRHYDDLMARVRALGLGDRFRHLGMVSYEELIALMRYSVAVINPSRFEGWSSTVEEAKSIGKRVLLSDIAVHFEQAPERGQFFAPDDPAALAELLIEAWRSFDDAAEDGGVAEAARLLPLRMGAFGSAYQDIVTGAVGPAGARGRVARAVVR
jgi:glycosyltransferase involved in cell wall biosynthesis